MIDYLAHLDWHAVALDLLRFGLIFRLAYDCGYKCGLQSGFAQGVDAAARL